MYNVNVMEIMNIETASSKKLPVMVFIHGGGYLMGSPNGYGPDFLINYDVILVSYGK